MTLPPGTRLGSFEILAPLGAGGMGEVYRAKDLRLGREVALKVLPLELASHGRLARFEQEARAASALNHPNIVAVYEVGREGETSYIAMELVEGKTLREIVALGAMPVRKVLQTAAQAAEGLAKAHAAGIVHRDLKPENLMVSRDGFVKILDFGLAKLSEAEPAVGGSSVPTLAKPETHPGTVMGTVGYMSPEQAAGQPLDYRSDQFSLGSILYELLSGEKAFFRKTAAETLSAIIRDEPEPLGKLRPQTPPPVRWIVERCLAKDPEERYASTRDLARDLAGVRDHVSEIGSGSGPVAAPQATPRAKLRRLSAATLLLVAGLASGWLASRVLREAPAPSFHRLTFRNGSIGNARFTPDGQTIVYGASWGDLRPRTLYQTRPESPESRAFDFGNADILAISRAGEMALRLDEDTLARVPLAGGVPRPVLKDVDYASIDWTPDGKDFAAVRNVGGRARLESPIGRVLLETSEGLYSPRFSPRGAEIVVFRGNTSYSILLVETASRRQRTLSAGWTDFAGVPCWTPDGREIWFTATRDERLRALYAVSQSGQERMIVRVPGSLELDDISAQGRVLLAHHTDTYKMMGKGPAESDERDLSWLDQSFPTALSEDGKTLIFVEGGEGGGVSGSVYMRGTDGTPAVRLGDGTGARLSPDGQWVVSIIRKANEADTLMLLPTGAGQPRPIATPGLETIAFPSWMPDGKRLLLGAVEHGKLPRAYLEQIATGSLRPVSDENVWPVGEVSPDGTLFLGSYADAQFALYPVEGGPPRPIPGLESRETPRQWTEDGGSLYVFRRGGPAGQILLLNLRTGEQHLWRELRRPGNAGILTGVINRRGDAYAYLLHASLSELYLVDGLR